MIPTHLHGDSLARTCLASVFLVSVTAGPVSAAPVCTLVLDASTNATLVRVGEKCDIRVSPASTFKIPLSLMGFDGGILKTAHTPAWPYKDEYRTSNEQWKRTTDPTSWLRDSVVWYSQELTRAMGFGRFKEYVEALGYGNRDLTGDSGRDNGLTNAWLSSSLQISPAEQVAIVRRLIKRELPFSAQAMDNTLSIMPTFPSENGWTVWGKTGTGSRRRPDGTNDPERQFGWFVGWARRGPRTVIFARLIEDDRPDAVSAGPRARDSMLTDLPVLLHETAGHR